MAKFDKRTEMMPNPGENNGPGKKAVNQEFSEDKEFVLPDTNSDIDRDDIKKEPLNNSINNAKDESDYSSVSNWNSDWQQ
jgi:hypothetical protein